MLVDRRILTHAFFMVGFPTETEEEVQATIDFSKEIDAHTASFFIVNPFKGTELADMVEERGGKATGDYLVTASMDKTVRIWSPGVPAPLDDPKRLLEYLRTATRACLTPGQLARYLDMPFAKATSEFRQCERAKQRLFGAARPGIATAESESAK